jgi:16S rRNA (guanine527-N7)-methyltransferase
MPPDLDVSRETRKKLERFQELLLKWQSKINLVGPGTLAEVWNRHFLDSAQLYKFVLKRSDSGENNLIDLGSGAGFPGLVLAIMGCPSVTLIESNHKKCTFLRNVARETNTTITVFEGRIEAFEAPNRAKIITSRALAPLDKLLSLACPLLDQSGFCLFLKGARHEQELTLARKGWNMKANTHKSATDPNGVVLEIEGISHKL